MSTSTTTHLSDLKAKLSRISAMRRLWLVTFRCMSEQATLSDADLDLAGASDKKLNELIATIHKVAIFPKERLSPLRRICNDVYRELKDKGILLGNSGAYIIPNSYTAEVQAFLEERANAYRHEIDTILRDYTDIYTAQVAKATQDIADVHLREVIIDLIPTKEEFKKRTYCTFAPYALALSEAVSDTDLEQVASSLEAIHNDENRRFLGKIYELYATYTTRLNAELSATGKTRLAQLNNLISRSSEVFARLDLALRGTAAYADLCAMRKLQARLNDEVVIYTETIASGPYVADFLIAKLKLYTEALSSEESFKRFTAPATPEPSAMPQPKADAITCETYSVTNSDLNGDEDVSFNAQPFDISDAIKAVRSLHEDSTVTTAKAVELCANPKILTQGKPAAVKVQDSKELPQDAPVRPTAAVGLAASRRFTFR